MRRRRLAVTPNKRIEQNAKGYNRHSAHGRPLVREHVGARLEERVEVPNLDRAVEASVPARSGDFGSYLTQLRQDVLPHIRKLEEDGHVRWSSFLMQPAAHLLDHDANDRTPVIHLRFEPALDLEFEQFIELLPAHFENPAARPLSEIEGLDATFLCDGDWARAWHLAGEASAWALNLIEDHQATPPPQQVVQLLHFVANASGLGGSCLWVPGGFLPF